MPICTMPFLPQCLQTGNTSICHFYFLFDRYSSGQVCSNGTRVFLHADIHDAFIKSLLERTSALVKGDPTDVKTHIGPMRTKFHMKRVQEYVRIGKEIDKARMVYPPNGKCVSEMNAPFSEGYFMDPVVFTDCTDEMMIVKEEIFGMV